MCQLSLPTQGVLAASRYELEVTQTENIARSILQHVKAFGVSSRYPELVCVVIGVMGKREGEGQWIPFSLSTLYLPGSVSSFPFHPCPASDPQPFRDDGSHKLRIALGFPHTFCYLSHACTLRNLIFLVPS